jgi:hypothetical protein
MQSGSGHSYTRGEKGAPLRPIAIAVFALLSLATTASAQRVAVIPKIGTLGVGADLALKLSDSVHVRAGYTTATIEQEQETQGVNYDAELEVGGPAVMLDFHPGGRSFRLSIGGISNATEAEARSTDETVINLNGQPYNVSEVGTLVGTATYEGFAPYAGIGWGNAFSGGRWSFHFDLGAAYVGEPEVDLVAVRTNPNIPFPPGFEEDLAAEEAELREEMSDYEFYPVVSFGVGFRF